MTLRYISHKQCDGDWLITCETKWHDEPSSPVQYFGDGLNWWVIKNREIGRPVSIYQMQLGLINICARLRWEEKRGVLE